ncbi:cullin-associated NEDD8-dissociated protein 1 [Tanacetum coccineum]
MWLCFTTIKLGECTLTGTSMARDLFERALIACVLHVAEGSKIWEAYRSYEEVILKKMNKTNLEHAADETIRLDDLREKVKRKIAKVRNVVVVYWLVQWSNRNVDDNNGRTVDLGPFKHTVDDGLELRKAAFECVDTLLDNCLDQLNPSSFIVPYLKSGLDVEIRWWNHLKRLLNFRPKQDVVKQEVDCNEDMIQSALRAISSLNHIIGGDCSHNFKNLMTEIEKSQSLWEKYCSINNE